jgi:hypothetical protein
MVRLEDPADQQAMNRIVVDNQDAGRLLDRDSGFQVVSSLFEAHPGHTPTFEQNGPERA